MALDNFKFNMTQQNTYKTPIRNRPSKYAQTPLAKRARFEVSEGIRPAEYFGVHRYLPAGEKDITHEDYVVLPKGRIVSAVTEEQTQPSGVLEKGGDIYGFKDQTNSGADATYLQDESYFGYDEHICGLLVPANGGTTTKLYYTSNDVDAETATALGFDLTAANTDGTRYINNPANAPVGVVYHDWYQDIRGKYLNYKMHTDGGHVLCDFFVEVPYAKIDSDIGTSVQTPAFPEDATHRLRARAADTFAHRQVIRTVSDQYTYMTIDINTATAEPIQPGVFVQSDALGNYMIQGGTSALTQTANPQTVGKLFPTDTRWPKDGLEDVLTYPGSRMPGSQTAGTPSFLFEFAVACELAAGNSSATIEDVIGYIRAGKYGIARIQLHIA